MANFPGRKVNLGCEIESTRGTVESTMSYWFPLLEADFFEKNSQVKNTASYGVKEQSVGMDIVQKSANGAFTFNLTDKTIGVFLKSLLGTLSSAANADVSGNVYDHTITVDQATVSTPSFTLAYADDVQDYSYALAVAKSIELNAELGEYVKATVEFVSKKGATASHTVSITSENKFRMQDVTFKLATTQSGLTAASAINIKAINLNIENNAREDFSLGSVDPTDVVAPSFVITGTVTLNYGATTYRDLFTAGTAYALRLDIKNLDVTIGTAANPQLRIDLHNITFPDYSQDRNLDDLVTQELSFEGHYKTADSKSLTCTLTNLVTAYTAS